MIYLRVAYYVTRIIISHGADLKAWAGLLFILGPNFLDALEKLDPDWAEIADMYPF
jgi:hypothetical protein